MADGTRLGEPDVAADARAVLATSNSVDPPALRPGETVERIVRYVRGPGYDRLELLGVGGDRQILGVASTSLCNANDTVLLTEGAILTLPCPLLWAHGSTKGRKAGDVPTGTHAERLRIGELVAILRDADQIVVRAVVDHTPAGDHAWRLISGGLARCFSVGAVDCDHAHQIEGVTFVQRWTLAEVSVCVEGANPEGRFVVVTTDRQRRLP